MPPEVLAQKSQKWIQMQRKRYGEKRKGGYVDMGKQVCCILEFGPFSLSSTLAFVCRIFRLSMSVKSSRTTAT
jgi:hypothetical protein